MAAAVVQEPEVTGFKEPVIDRVENVPDEVREAIIPQRQAGTTLAELKRNFADVVTGDVIRDLLPPGNVRERKAREAKQAKVTTAKRGIGGRSGEAKSDPKPPKAEQPKEPKARRYIGDQDLVTSLAERAVACRQVMGRNALAEALGVTGSACWRFENGRIHPAEVEALKTGLAEVEKRIAVGEFVKPERRPAAKRTSRDELERRHHEAIEYLRGGTSGSGKAVAQAVLAILDPPAEAATDTQ